MNQPHRTFGITVTLGPAPKEEQELARAEVVTDIHLASELISDIGLTELYDARKEYDVELLAFIDALRSSGIKLPQKVQKTLVPLRQRVLWQVRGENPPLDGDPLDFVKAGDQLIPIHAIRSVDISDVENQQVVIYHDHRGTVALGFDAVEVIMRLKPSALEGRRLRWRQGAWALHNLLYHPLTQVLAWLGLKRQAIRLHDWSTPAPRGFR